MQTEFPFSLPRGYVGPDGKVHRDGTMRLAQAGDEILPLQDPRVRGNRAYLVVLILAQVTTRLGELSAKQITPEVIENLFSGDLAYLQDFYRDVNGLREREISCPHCGRSFDPSGADRG